MVRRIEYSTNKLVTALIADEATNSVWIAFNKDTNNKVIIERKSAFEPTQTFFSLERSVDKVSRMAIDTTNLYVAYEDTTLLGEVISLTNPLTNVIPITRPIGINENPIDVAVNGSDLYFLLPGDISGENTKVLVYSTTGVFQEIIDLSQSGKVVENSHGMTTSDIGDIWLTTFTDPSALVRIFELSGGIFDYTIF